MYTCAYMYLIVFECAVDHQWRLLLHPLNDGMGHTIIRLGAGLSSRNTVLIINILLGWPKCKNDEEIYIFRAFCPRLNCAIWTESKHFPRLGTEFDTFLYFADWFKIFIIYPYYGSWDSKGFHNTQLYQVHSLMAVLGVAPRAYPEHLHSLSANV